MSNQNPNDPTNGLANQQSAVNTTTNKSESNLPEYPQANQPHSEAERQQQLQDAHLENQDARVSLSELQPDTEHHTQHQNHQSEQQESNSNDTENNEAENNETENNGTTHKEIGDMNQSKP